MNDTKNEEINLLNIQNIVTAIYIVSLIISIYITSVDKRNLENNTNFNTDDLSKFNRILVVILTLIFLYISIENRNIAKRKNKDISLYNLQVSASILSLISTLIVTYVIFKSCGDNYSVISGIENPNL